jgi:putative hydrolase of the HAD superfamily
MTGDLPDTWDAVFYDIGGVVVHLPSIRGGYADYLQAFAAEHDLDPEDALQTWRETLGAHFKSAEGNEYKTAREGYRRAFGALVDGIDEEDWRPGFERATGEALEPEPHVVETIERLDDAGLYLGIVSDIDTWEAHRMLDRFGIADAFDGITTSEDVGYKKPDGRMFADAFETAGEQVAPERSLMIGDRYDHDMRGGKEAGLWTVAYGGTAAEEIADVERDGLRVVGDDAVDFHAADHRDVLEIVGLES